ncbi:TPA: IS66 family insertion sequence element accessory protein TnpB [Legionella pneumophila]|nr:IS66 family insertion sequence element accessory protein TnpB [Legionella pneumophila]HBD7173655.1 IS66 family insertion sequence element accessory protein TnpB [Legionella pneumophila]HCU5989939.1 IS66 family insertion sequence element accessory protein TnpB [Legionella pneumophila]HDP7979108.1 IS66 family insertion sequence element accessory protein TnpB [Legionella pneumophila]HEM6948551.1 IS66 family insertion sequence element accessory protein TnpB [Legionella pneumophila]
MLQVTPQHRLLLAIEPIDFRAGIDGLKAACQQRLGCDPFSGTIFAFANRARTSVKLLVYDASGFWLCQKRFSSGKLAWWPSGHSKTVTLRASELHILLAQGDPMKAAIPEDWRPLKIDYAADANTVVRLS